MIYPDTGWSKTVQYDDNYSATIFKLEEQLWIYRYPIPTIIMYDTGK